MERMDETSVYQPNAEKKTQQQTNTETNKNNNNNNKNGMRQSPTNQHNSKLYGIGAGKGASSV